MSKYDMLCENCGVVEIEHSIHEDHPENHSCGGKMQRYFGDQKRPTIKFIGRGDIDGWASQRIDRQPMTSPESEAEYE